MRHTFLWSAWLVAGVLALATACDKGKVTVRETSIEFVFPLDGANLGPDDDVNTTEPGIQVNVEARVQRMNTGDNLVLTNSVTVDSTGAPVETVGTVQGDTVQFPGYTVPSTPSGLTRLRIATPEVEASDECDSSNCAEVRVSVTASDCLFNTPADNATLSAADEPAAYQTGETFDPFEIDVLVDCRGAAEGDDVILTVNGGLEVVAQLDANGRATFSQVVLEEGPNALVATHQTTTGPGAAATAAVTLSTGQCLARLSPVDGSRLLANDDDNLNPDDGMQVVLNLITDCADTPQPDIRLWVMGPGDSTYTEVTLSPPGGVFPTVSDILGTRFDLGAIDLPESSDEFDVLVVAQVVEDGAVREGTTIPARYWVDSRRPVFASKTPEDQGCVGVLQDLYPQAGIQIDAYGLLTGAEDGAEVWGHAYSATVPETTCTLASDCDAPLECRAGICRVVTTVQSGSFLLPEVDMPVGVATLVYVAHDLAGNIAEDGEVRVNVFDTQPTLSISSLITAARVIDPPDGAALGIADDQSGADDVQVEVVISHTDVPTGAAGNIFISNQDANIVPFTPDASADSTAVMVSLADGEHTLRVEIQDACGNDIESGAITLTVTAGSVVQVATAQVVAANTCDTHGTSGDCATAGCAWTFTDGGVACVAPVAYRTNLAPGATTTSAAIDLDVYLSTAAGPRDVTITVQDTFSGGVCSGSPPSGASIPTLELVPGTASGVIVRNVAVGEGSNCFTITSDDGINVVTSVLEVKLRTSVPTPTITSPSAGTLATDSNPTLPGFNQDVTVTLDAANDVAGELVLHIGTHNQTSVAVGAGQTDISLADVSLPEGTYDLVAEYVDIFGNASTSAAVTITIDTNTGEDQPQIAITSPGSGELVNDPDFTVAVALTGGETPETCDLFVVDYRADTTSPAVDSASWGTNLVASGTADGIHYVRVQCVNASGTGIVGISQTVRVIVDATPPADPVFIDEEDTVPGYLVFDSSSRWVNGQVEDVSAMPGLQHPVAVEISTGGASQEGFVVRLIAGGAAYEQEPPFSGLAVTVVFPAVDFGASDSATADDFALTATLVDPAGNEAQSPPVAAFTVDRTAPVLTQVAPVSAVIGSADDLDQLPPYVDIEIEYDVEGVMDPPEITVVPAPANISTFPVAMTLTGTPPCESPACTATTPRLSFVDGIYYATAVARDPAGNETTVRYDFEVDGATGEIIWWSPDTPGPLNVSSDEDIVTAGWQGRFVFNYAGFEAGTVLRLCSTVPSPAGGTTPCRWGTDGQGGQFVGVEVATRTLTSPTGQGQAILTNVFLDEGPQVLHAEAREADGAPDSTSLFFDFTVDTSRPDVTLIDLVQNDPANDPDPPVVLNSTERNASAPVAGELRVDVNVQVTGAPEGQTVAILADTAQVGSGTLASGEATFEIVLPEGSYALTARVTDEQLNPNDPDADTQPPIDVRVDVTEGTATVPGHPALFTSADGTPVGSVMPVDVVVTVSDNDSLAGATLTLRSFDADTGGTELYASAPMILTDGQTDVTVAAFELHEGNNYLEAEFTDAAGNGPTLSARVLYTADFLAPEITLALTTNGAVEPSCPEATPCDVTTVDAADGRVQLDPVGDGPGGADESDLIYSLCDRDAFTGACSADAIPIWLESQIIPATGFVEVHASRITGGGEVVAGTSYFDDAPDWAFDPGLVREIKLVAEDLAGNRSESASLFLDVDHGGVLIQTERLEGGASVGDILADGRFFGQAENDGGTTTLIATFGVTVTGVTGTETIDQVDLLVNSTAYDDLTYMAGDGWYEAPNIDLELVTDPIGDVTLPTPRNNLVVTVWCAPGPIVCGTRTYADIVADIAAPQFQYDRCTLLATGIDVPLAGPSTTCTNAAVDEGADGDIVGAGSPAIWSAADDQDGDPSNGFTINSPDLRVKVYDVGPGVTVTLESNWGGLTGATAPTENCVAYSGAYGTSSVCEAIFDNLGVPTLSDEGVHQLTITADDRAGNAGTTARASDTIHARTDVMPPDAVAATVCIGESTTPYDVGDPTTDPRTYEDPVCTGECTATGECSRRLGMATLTWVASGDDGDGTGDMVPVSSYEILYAPLGIPVDGTTHTACNLIPDTGPFEGVVPYIPGTPAAPGARETTSITGLYPHRDYCFYVRAIDDLGNAPMITTAVTDPVEPTERVLPLITYPNIVSFGNDADPAGLYDDDATTDTDFGRVITNVGDLDGDGLDDFAAARPMSTPGSGSAVQVFASMVGATPIEITGPTDGEQAFGAALAGGDFNADGNSDLAICAKNVTTGAGAGAGAVYLYYGVDNIGIRQTVNSADSELPGYEPDVALFGEPGSLFCNIIAMGNVDDNTLVNCTSDLDCPATCNLGNNTCYCTTDADCPGSCNTSNNTCYLGAELLVGANNFVTPAWRGVFGWFGSPTRFTGTVPIKVYLDLTSGASPGAADRPDFSVQESANAFILFPSAVTVADVNGDGVGDLAVADSTASHDASTPAYQYDGEVYVYTGGSGLSGVIAAPNTLPTALMHTLRYASSAVVGDYDYFGNRLLTIPNPRGVADAADWLAVQVSSSPNEVVIFEGVEGAGIVPADYPAGGRPADEYLELDHTLWDGTTSLPSFGWYMCAIGDLDGHGGPEIIVNPSYTAAGATGVGVMYSFDPTFSQAGDPPYDPPFVKRAILAGRDGFPVGCAGIGDHLNLGSAAPTQFVIGAAPESPDHAAIFIFR